MRENQTIRQSMINLRYATAFTLTLAISSHAIGQCDWAPLPGGGVSPAADACVLLPSGDLVFGGRFSLAGTTPVEYIARWDGSSWHPFGSGLDNFVRALLAMPNGDVIAGGQFLSAGGTTAELIARWDGTQWHRIGPLNSGLEFGSVRSLALLPNGDLMAGGSFLAAGGAPAQRAARWDGTQWTAMGALYQGVQPSAVVSVLALAVLPNGDIVAGGSFLKADSDITVNRVARWDGAGWNPMGSGMSSAVNALAVMPNGDLVAGGIFSTAGGVTANGVARWDGVSWHALGTGLISNTGALSNAYAMCVMPSGKLAVGGVFDTAGGAPASMVATWDPTISAWSPIGSGMQYQITRTVSAMAADTSGNLFAAGQFSQAGGLSVTNVAQFRTDASPVVFLTQPQARHPAPGGSAVFEVQLSGAVETYQWQRESAPGNGIWLDMDEGPNSFYGIFSGTTTNELTISDAVADRSFALRCVAVSSCGGVMSNTAQYSVCYANCDNSAGSHPLNIFDYICFGNAYAAGDPYADCDGNSTLNIFDYICFGNAYGTGCP
ncbi:MAG: hypothetical protein H6815_07115 [Phycisphaeraceae bacterium]|nr:hypothetical protein [Phycisphaerales bacterium]MCB9860210.1 hypothetical protein [Phycisphaeraceae bacterium]